MSPESNNGVYTTDSEKLRYLMRKATNDPGGDFYRRTLTQMEEHIRQVGIEGDSGKHYEIGDIVVGGQLVGGNEEGTKKCLAVFRLPTLTEYMKDGLPVEMVNLGELKLSQFLYLFGPNIGKLFRLDFFKGKFGPRLFK